MSVYDQSIHLSSLLRTLQSKALFCRGSALADKVSGLGPKVLLFRILLRTGILFFPVEVFSCPGSTVFRVVRVDISSFEMLFAQAFTLFSPKHFFRILSLSFLCTLSVCNGQVHVQLFLPLWDEVLPDSDGFCVTLESRLPAAT